MRHILTGVLQCTLHSYAPSQNANLSQVEETKKMIDDPKEAERILRETLKQSAGLGTKPKEGGESAVARFERFKAALKEEVSKDYKTGANSSSRSDKRPSDMASRAAARRGRK